MNNTKFVLVIEPHRTGASSLEIKVDLEAGTFVISKFPRGVGGGFLHFKDEGANLSEEHALNTPISFGALMGTTDMVTTEVTRFCDMPSGDYPDPGPGHAKLKLTCGGYPSIERGGERGAVLKIESNVYHETEIRFLCPPHHNSKSKFWIMVPVKGKFALRPFSKTAQLPRFKFSYPHLRGGLTDLSVTFDSEQEKFMLERPKSVCLAQESFAGIEMHSLEWRCIPLADDFFSLKKLHAEQGRRIMICDCSLVEEINLAKKIEAKLKRYIRSGGIEDYVFSVSAHDSQCALGLCLTKFRRMKQVTDNWIVQVENYGKVQIEID